MQMSIKETKEVVTFVVKLIKAVDASMSDGKLGVEDSAHFFSAMMASASAVSGISDVVLELKDLSQPEVDELVELVKAELTLTSTKAEVIIESAIEIGVSLFRLINMVKT